MKYSRLMICLFIVLTIVAIIGENGFCNGGKGKKIRYLGEIKIKDGELWAFTVEIEEIMFLINSVKDKYKVFRIRINNFSDKKIKLSIEEDKVDVHFENNDPITGIIDLYKVNQALWDSFTPELRRKLVYPRIVEAEEEESIFVFIPNPELIKKAPKSFHYTISDVPKKEVRIERLLTALR